MSGEGETWTHGDLNALVGEDEGGVGGSELGRLGRSASGRVPYEASLEEQIGLTILDNHQFKD